MRESCQADGAAARSSEYSAAQWLRACVLVIAPTCVNRLLASSDPRVDFLLQAWGELSQAKSHHF